jgi:pyruvate-formate lyase-activating enzyme
VEPERQLISSCCAAHPEKIDLAWLAQNPKQLFNTPKLVKERSEMLENIPVASCRDTCWSVEDRQLPSRRTLGGSDVKTHKNIFASPKVLNIVIGTDCNLTCVYCCKQLSMAWLRDIQNNGPYFETERFMINDSDILRIQTGQKQIQSSYSYHAVLDQASHYEKLEKVEITGGEPFLYNALPDLLKKFHAPTYVFTGLGVDPKRFRRMIGQLHKNVTLVISAENLHQQYEFIRYGNTYQKFLQNLEIIKESGLEYKFSIVLSNLTIHAYKEFEDKHGNKDNIILFCNDPVFLAMNVMDDESKKALLDLTYKYRDAEIKQALIADCSTQQKSMFVSYIKEFASRRKLSLEVFPKSFRRWIENGC